LPGSRVDYWGPKLARNQERDREHLVDLKEMGWHSLVIWECETEDKLKLIQRMGAFLGSYAKAKGLRHKA
jgi:DNA mismatch endonuclease (patch repair protein)